MFLTGETWWLGFSVDRLRLIVLLILLLPLLVGLSYFQGFEKTFGWKDDLLDAFVAYGVGFILAATLLPLFSIIEPSMSLNEIVGKLAIQAVPGSIGALLARSQLGGSKEETRQKRKSAGYRGEMFLMVVGAVFLALNLAPTHELVLLSQMVTWRQSIGLVVVTIVVMQAFTYAIDRQESESTRVPILTSFFRFTVAGFGVALLISLYMLWSFARTDGLALDQVVHAMLVLGFPASVGAAASRLIL
jgi:putative integral membrane protein (TIGR02587 family)